MTARADAILVMGVAGVGKTTIGLALAERLRLPFLDADDLHPPQNVTKMRSGIALDDADRAPWLAAVGDWIDRHGGGCVVACSALKRAYRLALAGDCGGCRLVFVNAPETVVRERMAQRRDHYFPAALIASQFEALEAPAADEAPILSDAALPLAEQVDRLVEALAQMPAYHS